MKKLVFPADAETTEMFNNGVIDKILVDVGIDNDDIDFSSDQITVPVDDAILSDLGDYIEQNPEEEGSKVIAMAIAGLTESEESDDEDEDVNADNEVEEEGLNEEESEDEESDEDDDENMSLDENQQQLKDAVKDIIKGNTDAAADKVKNVMSKKMADRYENLKFRTSK